VPLQPPSPSDSSTFDGSSFDIGSTLEFDVNYVKEVRSAHVSVDDG
jgi:hypothetical protein